MIRTSGTSLVCLVHLMSLMQPNKPDRPNRPSKEPRPSRRGFCKPRGNLPPLRYGLPFLLALPSGVSWQIFMNKNEQNRRART